MYKLVFYGVSTLLDPHQLTGTRSAVKAHIRARPRITVFTFLKNRTDGTFVHGSHV